MATVDSEEISGSGEAAIVRLKGSLGAGCLGTQYYSPSILLTWLYGEN
jgi:hypothetical protein